MWRQGGHWHADAVVYHTNQYRLMGSYLPVTVCSLFAKAVGGWGSISSLQSTSHSRNLVNVGFLGCGVIHIFITNNNNKQQEIFLRLHLYACMLKYPLPAPCVLPPRNTLNTACHTWEQFAAIDIKDACL